MARETPSDNRVNRGTGGETTGTAVEARRGRPEIPRMTKFYSGLLRLF